MTTPTLRLTKYDAALALIQEIDVHNALRAAGKEITTSDHARMGFLVKQYDRARVTFVRVPHQRKPLE